MLITLLIIFEIYLRSYCVNSVEYKIPCKIVLNTDEKIFYAKYPNNIFKYYKEDDIKIYTDSIRFDSITYKDIRYIIYKRH